MLSKPTIGFAGLGAMGSGMAIHLVKAGGFTVYGYDVSAAQLKAFVDSGGHAAETPCELASHADVLISMVADAAQNTSLLFDDDNGAVKGLGSGKTIVLCSTTAPEFVSELRARLDAPSVGRSDIRLVDAPVSGGALRAAEGTLSIFAAGADDDVKGVRAVLDCMAECLYCMGALGDGMRAKTVHQLLAATNIISAAEGMGLAANVGLNTQAVYEHVCESDGASFMFENRVPHMLQGEWQARSALAIILKDTGIVTGAARLLHQPTPLASAAEQSYLRGVRAGLLRDDDARLVQLYLPPTQGDLVARMTQADRMMASSHQVSKATVVDLLAGIHLAAAVEAMAFCQALGVDRAIMCEIITKAAGGSRVFGEVIPGMLKADQWSLADCPQAAEYRDRLADAVDRCRDIRYPCHMAATALQQFHLADLAGKVVANTSRSER
jgi:3-hydroxyisobutyrate dehydrogenase